MYAYIRTLSFCRPQVALSVTPCVPCFVVNSCKFTFLLWHSSWKTIYTAFPVLIHIIPQSYAWNYWKNYWEKNLTKALCFHLVVLTRNVGTKPQPWHVRGQQWWTVLLHYKQYTWMKSVSDVTMSSISCFYLFLFFIYWLYVWLWMEIPFQEGRSFHWRDETHLRKFCVHTIFILGKGTLL